MMVRVMQSLVILHLQKPLTEGAKAQGKKNKLNDGDDEDEDSLVIFHMPKP
jgi:hypothetical protein